MKRALAVVLFLLFTIGVCVDEKEELVSVTERDSVTLKSGVTKRQTDDGFEWRFNGTRIAKISRGDSETWVKPDGLFKDRLQLDNQTGDLKISNISTTDSGEYKVKISSPSGSSEIIFTVKVVPVDVSAAVVKSVTVTEGYPVTLRTDPTYIQGDDVIQWRFGPQKSLVAEMNIDAGIFNTYDGPEGKFRDRLKLDRQSAHLTIKNTRITDSGDYEVEISSSSSRYTIHHIKSFSLTVRDYVEKVSVMKGDNVPLHPDLTGTERIEQIRWMFGDDEEVIADLNGTANKDNFGLNNQNGELTIRNIQTDQSGDYKVEIKTRTMIFHRKYQITVVALPGPRLSPDDLDPCLSSDGRGLSPAAVAGIGAVCFLLGAAVGAAGVICYRYKRSKDSKDNQMQNQPLKRQLAMDNMDMDSKDNQMQNQPLKGQLADDTENVSMKNLCGSQSAESDTENSPFREIKGNKEHGYEIL